MVKATTTVSSYYCWFFLLLQLLLCCSSCCFALEISSENDDVLFPNGTGVTRSSFPPDFLFGAITSSMKHEGAQYQDGKSNNIWDVYATREGSSQDGAVPGQCGDNYNRYEHDHKLLTDLGMNAYRFSIAWSRLFPNGTSDVNEVAIAHYNKVIDSVLEQGLVPMVSLWTQDHPHILDATYGGPLSNQFIDDFALYAETCFREFGDRIKLWITFDEANDWSGLGYSTDQNPPGRCTPNIVGMLGMNYGNCPEGDSGTEPYIVAHHLLLAHAEAVNIYRNKYQAAQNGSIGLALWFRWLEPLTNSSGDIAGAQRGTDFLVGWFLDPIFFGDYPASMREIVGSRLPVFTDEELAKVKGSLDFIGLNIQAAYYAFERNFYEVEVEKCYYLDWMVNVTGYRDGVPMGPGDLEFAVPWCMRKAVDYVKLRYNNFPVYVTQTGWALTYNSSDDTLEDDSRVEFFETYYDELSIAIRNGANVKGVFAWSLMDGFEFNLGLGLRAGIYYVDNNLDRYPRKSALWFKEMLSQNSSIDSLGSRPNVL